MPIISLGAFTADSRTGPLVGLLARPMRDWREDPLLPNQLGKYAPPPMDGQRMMRSVSRQLGQRVAVGGTPCLLQDSNRGNLSVRPGRETGTQILTPEGH
jgi:hypothetical protein